VKEVGFRKLLYSTAAYFIIIFYIHLSYVQFNIISIHPREQFMMPLLHLGIMASFAWMLSLTRHQRMLKLARTKGIQIGDTLSIGEGLNSLAIILFAFQTVLWFGGIIAGWFGWQ